MTRQNCIAHLHWLLRQLYLLTLAFCHVELNVRQALLRVIILQHTFGSELLEIVVCDMGLEKLVIIKIFHHSKVLFLSSLAL